eukprot:5757625-Prymnesium_polylepis.1
MTWGSHAGRRSRFGGLVPKVGCQARTKPRCSRTQRGGVAVAVDDGCQHSKLFCLGDDHRAHANVAELHLAGWHVEEGCARRLPITAAVVHRRVVEARLVACALDRVGRVVLKIGDRIRPEANALAHPATFTGSGAIRGGESTGAQEPAVPVKQVVKDETHKPLK